MLHEYNADRICADFFIGLNAIRALSIISMILVFASSIFVLVTDIQAVNHFMKDASDSDMTDCDYIEYVIWVRLPRTSSHACLCAQR